MLLHTFTNILVKKLFGNNLVGRFVKYLIKSPYYRPTVTSTKNQLVNMFFLNFTDIAQVVCPLSILWSYLENSAR